MERLERDKTYVIDWDKVHSIGEIKGILAKLPISFEITVDYQGQFEDIKDFLREKGE